MQDIWRVVLQALLSFLVLFIISKLLGKKQVAQLEFIDYAVGISIGSIAAQMAIENEVPYYHFIIAMVIYGVVDILITLISRKAKFLKAFFKGEPLILIEHGQINYKNLLKSKLDINELFGQCRIAGYFNIEDIEFCIFENTGDVSILPNSQARPVKAQDFKLPEQNVDLPCELILDGKVITPALHDINKSEQWLFETLKIKNKKQLKNILIAIYNKQTQLINVQTKSGESSSIKVKLN